LGDLGDHAEIVGDEDRRRTRLGLTAGEQGQHLGLDGDVKGRGRLVGDDELRAAGHCHGNHGALAHAAGELVRVLGGADLRVGDVDLAQEFDGPRLGAAAVEAALVQRALDDLDADGHHGVERGRRVLEDDPDVAAAHEAQSLGVRPDHLLPAEADGAGHPRRVRQEPGDGERGDAFP
jgi:hypothetical protein